MSIHVTSTAAAVVQTRPAHGRWFVAPRSTPRAAARLFCFPYAGGNGSMFAPWARVLPETIEVVAAQLPGRMERFAEQPYAQLHHLVEAMLPALEPFLDRPFAFFGHSMGALVAFELARALRQVGLVPPDVVIVSGHGAPHLARRNPPTHDLPEPEFIAELRRLNGTPPEVLAHRELLELLLPTLRADFAVCETYSYQPDVPLVCPLVALGGVADADVSRDDLEAWGHHTAAGLSVRMLPGDHFFLNTSRHHVLAVIARELHALTHLKTRVVG